jgi:hypothetical protein
MVSVLLLSLGCLSEERKNDRSEDSYSRRGEEKGPAGKIRRW